MTNAETTAAVWHRDGRAAAAGCLASRCLGDRGTFIRDCAALREILASPAAESVIETARWSFVNQWGGDLP